MYSDGIKVDLTEEDIKEAIHWGSGNKDSSGNIFQPYIFGKPGSYEQGGIILTKTFSLALESCISAGVYKEISKAHIQKILRNKFLPILINTWGSKKDFLRGSRILLQQGQKIVQPEHPTTFKHADPVAGFLSAPYYRWVIGGLFPYSEIDPKAKTIVILIGGRGESRFEVDFSRYK